MKAGETNYTTFGESRSRTSSAPLADTYSCCTSSSDLAKPDRNEEEARAEEAERERVRKMREGWKAIRKGNQGRR